MRSPIITMCIACTARSMARRPRNVPAHPYLLLPRLVVTPGGSIAAVCSKHQLPPDWQFATHRVAAPADVGFLTVVGTSLAPNASATELARIEVCRCNL